MTCCFNSRWKCLMKWNKPTGCFAATASSTLLRPIFTILKVRSQEVYLSLSYIRSRSEYMHDNIHIHNRLLLLQHFRAANKDAHKTEGSFGQNTGDTQWRGGSTTDSTVEFVKDKNKSYTQGIGIYIYIGVRCLRYKHLKTIFVWIFYLFFFIFRVR